MQSFHVTAGESMCRRPALVLDIDGVLVHVGPERTGAWYDRLREDLGIDPLDADRSLLAARSVKDLVRWSGGLYSPPAQFRNW